MYQSPSHEPAKQRRNTLIFSLPALLVVCALLAGTAQAPVAKAVATANTQDLSPTERERRVSKLVSNVIERSHYRQSPINDPVSSLVLDRFIEQLDGGRSYFLASDIAEFERYRYQLDDAVVNGQLEPVFAIFNRFQQRNKERRRATPWSCSRPSRTSPSMSRSSSTAPRRRGPSPPKN